MTLVEGQNAPRPEPASERSHGQVGESEVEVGVLAIKLERYLGVVGFDITLDSRGATGGGGL